MDTTEDHPAALSPGWWRTQAPYVNVSGHAVYARHHVWTDDGTTHGLISLGSVDLTFHDPQQARDLIAKLAALAGDMDAEITRHAGSDLTVRPAFVPGFQPAAPVDGEPESCGRCGATDVPKADDGSCFNLSHCADRARDAAKATTP